MRANKVVNIKKVRFTKAGFEKMKAELEELQKSRPSAVLDLKKARELGDLSENGYYKAARMKLSSIDNRLFRMRLAIKQAVVMGGPRKGGAGIGMIVTLTDGKKEIVYRIVGDLEANPGDGKISLLSPIGRALEGRRVGDEVEYKTPMGMSKLKIVSISS
jgi:transcription elongation factor GreA